MEPPPEPIEEPPVEPIKPIEEPMKPIEEPVKPTAPIIIPGDPAASTPTIFETIDNGIRQLEGAVFGRNSDSDVPKVSEIVTPGGKPIGTVVGSATPDIRTVGSKQFANIQQSLLDGANPAGSYANGKGTWYITPNGETVGVRSSGKNGITIDLPGLKMKIHQQ